MPNHNRPWVPNGFVNCGGGGWGKYGEGNLGKHFGLFCLALAGVTPVSFVLGASVRDNN